MRQGKARVERNGSFKQLPAQPIVILGVPADMLDTTQQAIIGGQTVGGFARGASDFSVLQPSGQGRHGRASDLVLHLEQLDRCRDHSAPPKDGSRPGIDQLRGDAKPASALRMLPSTTILHAKLATKPLQIDALTPVLKRRVSRNDEQLTEPREFGDDVLGDAVAESIACVGIATHVGKGQHSD